MRYLTATPSCFQVLVSNETDNCMTRVPEIGLLSEKTDFLSH